MSLLKLHQYSLSCNNIDNIVYLTDLARSLRRVASLLTSPCFYWPRSADDNACTGEVEREQTRAHQN